MLLLVVIKITLSFPSLHFYPFPPVHIASNHHPLTPDFTAQNVSCTVALDSELDSLLKAAHITLLNININININYSHHGSITHTLMTLPYELSIHISCLNDVLYWMTEFLFQLWKVSELCPLPLWCLKWINGTFLNLNFSVKCFCLGFCGILFG